MKLKLFFIPIIIYFLSPNILLSNLNPLVNENRLLQIFSKGEQSRYENAIIYTYKFSPYIQIYRFQINRINSFIIEEENQITIIDAYRPNNEDLETLINYSKTFKKDIIGIILINVDKDYKIPKILNKYNIYVTKNDYDTIFKNFSDNNLKIINDQKIGNIEYTYKSFSINKNKDLTIIFINQLFIAIGDNLNTKYNYLIKNNQDTNQIKSYLDSIDQLKENNNYNYFLPKQGLPYPKSKLDDFYTIINNAYNSEINEDIFSLNN